MATYLFDFDGTLVDSMPTYVSSVLRILDEEGIAYGKDIVKILTPLGLRGCAEYFKGMGVQDEVEAVMERIMSYMTKAYLESIPAKESVIATLKALKARGDSLHVLTASPHSTLDPCLKRLGMYDLFENVWSCDDFNTTKANPEIYVQAAKKIGKPVGDIIFLDDNYNAVKTAKDAGMQVYGVYDDSSKEYIDEMKEISQKYIQDFSQLL